MVRLSHYNELDFLHYNALPPHYKYIESDFL
jgi:hypothetical protein